MKKIPFFTRLVIKKPIGFFAYRWAWLGVAILLQMVPIVCSGKNSFLVAPGRVEFDISKPSTESFIINNNGDNRIRLSIDPIYFDVASDSLRMGKHTHDKVKDIEDLTQYIRVSPKRLSLAPGQRRNIRISLRTPSSLPDGYYRAHLLVKMLETSTTTTSKESSKGGLGFQLGIKMETGVAIFGYKGKPDPRISVLCSIDEETDLLTLDVRNSTVWKFDGKYRIYHANERHARPVTEDFLLVYRESERSRLTEFRPKGKGPFLIEWKSNAEDDTNFTDSTLCHLPVFKK